MSSRERQRLADPHAGGDEQLPEFRVFRRPLTLAQEQPRFIETPQLVLERVALRRIAVSPIDRIPQEQTQSRGVP